MRLLHDRWWPDQQLTDHSIGAGWRSGDGFCRTASARPWAPVPPRVDPRDWVGGLVSDARQQPGRARAGRVRPRRCWVVASSHHRLLFKRARICSAPDLGGASFPSSFFRRTIITRSIAAPAPGRTGACRWPTAPASACSREGWFACPVGSICRKSPLLAGHGTVLT